MFTIHGGHSDITTQKPEDIYLLKKNHHLLQKKGSKISTCWYRRFTCNSVQRDLSSISSGCPKIILLTFYSKYPCARMKSETVAMKMLAELAK